MLKLIKLLKQINQKNISRTLKNQKIQNKRIIINIPVSKIPIHIHLILFKSMQVVTPIEYYLIEYINLIIKLIKLDLINNLEVSFKQKIRIQESLQRMKKVTNQRDLTSNLKIIFYYKKFKFNNLNNISMLKVLFKVHPMEMEKQFLIEKFNPQLQNQHTKLLN